MKKATIISDTGTIDDHLGISLPPEIIIDVLCRLPVKSLCRFKCVSPSWKTLISSPHFAQTHLNRTKANNNHPLYKAILFSSSFDLYSVDFADPNPTPEKLNFPWLNHMDGWYRSLSSCNGLVLVSGQGNVIFLLNPSTREYKELPESPFLKFSPFDVFYPPGLGYDPYTDDYKVVLPFCKYQEPNPANITNVAVYSLKTDAWKTIQDFPSIFVGLHRGVFFNERLHWLCRRTDYSKVVVAFDLVDEVFREVHLPALYDDPEYFRGHDMVVLGGCLCLLVWSNRDRIYVWMMMEYGVRDSWTKFLIANPGWFILDGKLCFSVQDELVLRKERLSGVGRWVQDEFEGDKLILCNPKKGTRRDVVVPGIPTKYVVGDHYIETVVSPNHGGGFQRQWEASSGESSKSYQLIGKEHPSSLPAN